MNKDNSNQKTDVTTRKRRSSKIAKSIMLCAVIGVFASAIVGLSVALYYAQTSVRVHETYQRQIDAVYRRAYYDLLDGASDLGVNLRKIGVSNSPVMQQTLLYEVWNTATLAEDNLGMLESKDDGILKAQSFVNQLGDFSHSLALKLARGESLSTDDRTTLMRLSRVADAYSRALEDVQRRLDEGELEMTDEGAMDSFVGAFSGFSEPSFDYPEMIYDGPFSSALEDRQPKGLSGEEISAERGAELIKEYFPSASDIVFVTKTESAISTLDYSLTLDGTNGYAQLAGQGGMLIMLSTSTYAQTGVSASSTCQQAAMALCEGLGFGDMQVVWSAVSDGECVVNLAPMQNGVVLYPDLVKVKLDNSNGRVLGFDASHYAYNHIERELSEPTITEKQARASLSMSPISEGRLSLIPLRETREVLAYEFECHNDGTYYIYIDAHTGDEVNILYVIDDETGERTI